MLLTAEMTRAAQPDRVCDRLLLLVEVVAINESIAVVEHVYGASAEIEDLRRRLHAVRAIVLAQLDALLPLPSGEVVH
jgi:hypothetical protein